MFQSPTKQLNARSFLNNRPPFIRGEEGSLHIIACFNKLYEQLEGVELLVIIH